MEGNLNLVNKVISNIYNSREQPTNGKYQVPKFLQESTKWIIH